MSDEMDELRDHVKRLKSSNTTLNDENVRLSERVKDVTTVLRNLSNGVCWCSFDSSGYHTRPCKEAQKVLK